MLLEGVGAKHFAFLQRRMQMAIAKIAGVDAHVVHLRKPHTRRAARRRLQASMEATGAAKLLAGGEGSGGTGEDTRVDVLIDAADMPQVERVARAWCACVVGTNRGARKVCVWDAGCRFELAV